MAEIASPVQIVIWRNELRVSVFMPVYGGADVWQFGNQVHGVFKEVLPILCLIHSTLVSLEE